MFPPVDVPHHARSSASSSASARYYVDAGSEPPVLQENGVSNGNRGKAREAFRTAASKLGSENGHPTVVAESSCVVVAEQEWGVAQPLRSAPSHPSSTVPGRFASSPLSSLLPPPRHTLVDRPSSTTLIQQGLPLLRKYSRARTILPSSLATTSRPFSLRTNTSFFPERRPLRNRCGGALIKDQPTDLLSTPTTSR